MIMADKQYNPVLQQQLEAYIVEAGSQESAAGRIGYSAGTLSQYRKGLYNGDVIKLEAKLREIFAVKEAAESYLSVIPDYAPTSISEKVYATIRLCHLKGGLAIECGDAGIGKTKAAKKYVQDFPSSAFYVCVNPCLTSVTAFLKLLCKTFRLPIGRKDDMWLELNEHLQGTKKVIIVDEAQHLTIKSIDSIRALFDENPGIGIIFIGNVETVTNRRNKSKTSFSQINNRTKLTEVRHTTHITLNDITLLFPALTGHDKELQLLHIIAQSEQGIRGAVNLYSNACDNENTSYEGLLAMGKQMKIIAGGF